METFVHSGKKVENFIAMTNEMDETMAMTSIDWLGNWSITFPMLFGIRDNITIIHQYPTLVNGMDGKLKIYIA